MGIGQPNRGAGRPIKHPAGNFKPPISATTAEITAEDNTACLLDSFVNADSKTKPRMPRIQQLAKFGIMGVLKPCCTTKPERIFP